MNTEKPCDGQIVETKDDEKNPTGCKRKKKKRVLYAVYNHKKETNF